MGAQRAMLNITQNEIDARRRVFDGVSDDVLLHHLQAQEDRSFEDAAIEVASLLQEFAARGKPVNFGDMIPWITALMNKTNRAESVELPKIVSIWEE